MSKPAPAPRLSALVDKSLFISDPSSMYRSPISDTFQDTPKDDLTASPLHVEPYPPRSQSKASVAMDTPAKKHVEGVYDRYVVFVIISVACIQVHSRFLMSTTGVKRVGMGYQSDNANALTARPKAAAAKRNPHFFLTSRRPMPPPVSSEDLRKSASVDEFGAITCAPVAAFNNKEDGSSAVGIVKRAFKAMTVKR